MTKKAPGYLEKVSDIELIQLIDNGIQNSVGDFLNSSDLAREREKSTYEYAGMPELHLAPNGVSSIVSTDTTETVEAYLAIISELMFNNSRIARCKPWVASPSAIAGANDASDLINYTIFKQNDGWSLMNTWVKSALLWKNSVIRWDWVEDYEVVYKEYDEITEEALDNKLSDSMYEIVGELEFDPSTNMYHNVRLKCTKDKSRVNIENIPPENFRISREARNIHTANFVGIQSDMSRSEVRKMWPDVADTITDWNMLSEDGDSWEQGRYSQDVAARKDVTGQEYWQGSRSQEGYPLEANRNVSVTECWIRVDRDGDGIAELKHFITCGNTVLFEEDVSDVPLASLCPIEIPYEFYGLSIADLTRSTTLTSTAILRGFVENTYLTNYSPKLADPNVVDFGALQNMKPKQIIPTNGSPVNAVQELTASNISPGTVPLLEYLQQHKEQATGMSKAAQGLQDELYVSGNSEVKLGQVMNATQKRIQHIARRFAEEGFKRLIGGVYKCSLMNRDKMEIFSERRADMLQIDMEKLPTLMDIDVDVDLGENSNANKREKLMMVATQLLPMLKEGGQGLILKPEATANIAFDLLNTMDLRPEDYLKDHTTEEFAQEVQQGQEKAAKEEEAAKALAMRNEESTAKQNEANAIYTMAQADNSVQDNVRQTAVAMDKHKQEWAKIKINAASEELDEAAINTLFEQPKMEDLMVQAQDTVKNIRAEEDKGDSIDAMVKQMGIDPKQAIQIIQQVIGGGQQ